jgi:hypothetical protein
VIPLARRSFNTYLDDELQDELREEARTSGKTVTTLLEAAVRSYLNNLRARRQRKPRDRPEKEG